jgi:hypothetical protein
VCSPRRIRELWVQLTPADGVESSHETAMTANASVAPGPGRPAWVSDELYPFESHYADVAGSRVHYIDEGSGPPLLLLHGNPTWSFLYRDIVKGLRDSYRCIAVDHPGFGLSRAARATATRRPSTPTRSSSSSYGWTSAT